MPLEPGRHLVVGTAGHIDHGKSALVRALTGIDPDRLQEEKRRGITIDLGFADLDLGAGRVLAFVDVPGHERFVRHMVAGAAGVDAVMLVVAADAGVQPQTREHLAICSLLGIRTGLVALTKCDLVPDELAALAQAEVEELVCGTFLERAPIRAVSAKTGAGMDELRDELARLFERQAPRPVEGVARLPVDRSFVLRGFGTVVTGTLVAGVLERGQEVEVLPGGARARIRGLQVHGQEVERARAGQRTAVNLQGLERQQAPRGGTLTAPGRLDTTRRIWCRLTLVPGAPASLERGGRVRFHQGTCERAAAFRVFGRDPDGSLRAELRLGDETVLVPGDRFILRRPAPVDTVAGGQVLDAHPPRRREHAPPVFDPQALEIDNGVALRLARAGILGLEPSAAARELGFTPADVEVALARLAAGGRAMRAGSRWIGGEVWRTASARALAIVETFHAAHPARSGLPREELRTMAVPGMPQELWRELLETLARSGELALTGESVAQAGHRVTLDARELALASRLERVYSDAGLEPPDLESVLTTGERALAAPVVAWLLASGRVTRIRDGRLFDAPALAALRERLRAYKATSRTIDVAVFKQLAGVTRKNAIPLLEQLDAERVTRRVGNLREILD